MSSKHLFSKNKTLTLTPRQAQECRTQLLALLARPQQMTATDLETFARNLPYDTATIERMVAEIPAFVAFCIERVAR